MFKVVFMNSEKDQKKRKKLNKNVEMCSESKAPPCSDVISDVIS